MGEMMSMTMARPVGGIVEDFGAIITGTAGSVRETEATLRTANWSLAALGVMGAIGTVAALKYILFAKVK